MSHDTMRAIVQDRIGAPADVLHLAEVPRPAPLPTEVLVRVHAAGINPVDWKTVEGAGMAAVLGDPPFTVGWDVSGVVEAVGYGVTRFAVGDEVLGMPWFPRPAAAYAEYVTAPSRHFVPKPTRLGHSEAAALPLAGLTAYQALVDTAGVAEGDRVLIHAGAGGVGHLAVQIAKARGAHVITTGREAKHAFLTELGADEVVDYTTTRFEDVITNMDVVIDLIGGETGVRSVATLREGGLLVGIPSGNQQAAEAAAAAGVRYTGFLVEPDHAGLEALTALVEQEQLRVVLDGTFPLEQAATALAQGAAGRTQGKLVLKVA